jgi:hypothetical protein
MRWPNTEPGATMEWLEYTLDNPLFDKPVRYRVNASFYNSHWSCQYGSCPGILMTGANEPDMACCQIGVTFGTDFERVAEAVAELTPADWDHAGTDWQDRWYYTKKRKVKGKTVHVPAGTQLGERGCILANEAGGPAGKPGCALHHLAVRTGRPIWETKPDICWQIPFAVTHQEFEDEYVVTVDGSVAQAWGCDDSDEIGHLGYWCTETPDAYVGLDPVWVSAEGELRQLMGDFGYEQMAERLRTTWRGLGMPGERTNGGRPLLPLLVKQRVELWERVAGDAGDAGEYARACLKHPADEHPK